MSIGPMSGIPASAAGAPLAQTKGSESERAAQQTNAQQRLNQSEAKAEAAAGIGETSEDQHAEDRDADGRRLWEVTEEEEHNKKDPAQETTDSSHEHHQVKDVHGNSGNALDLTG